MVVGLSILTINFAATSPELTVSDPKMYKNPINVDINNNITDFNETLQATKSHFNQDFWKFNDSNYVN
jgi:hypothetical protein